MYKPRFWAEQKNQSGVTNYPPPPQALGARASANEVISVRPNKGTAEQRDGRQGQLLITPPRTWVIMGGSRSLRARSRSLSALSGSLRAGSMRSLRSGHWGQVIECMFLLLLLLMLLLLHESRDFTRSRTKSLSACVMQSLMANVGAENLCANTPCITLRSNHYTARISWRPIHISILHA